MGRMRIAAVGVLAATVMSGCSVNPDAVRMGQFLIRSVTGAGGEKLSREQIAAVPYATMGLGIGASDQVLLVLGASSDQGLEWYAGERILVVTRDGRVLRTVGLRYDLGQLRVGSDTADNGRVERQFSVDFADRGAFGIPMRCRVTYAGNEDIEILGGLIPTRRRIESCHVEVLDWDFENVFWEDPGTGYVWRSRQHIHPQSPPIMLEVLRPTQNGPG